MSTVVIGVDPQKASNTLVVIDKRERVLSQDRSPMIGRLPVDEGIRPRPR